MSVDAGTVWEKSDTSSLAHLAFVTCQTCMCKQVCPVQSWEKQTPQDPQGPIFSNFSAKFVKFSAKFWSLNMKI